MKTEAFKGTIEEYQGTKVVPPIAYEGVAELYETLTEAKNSEDWLSDAEILRVINNKKLTAAKASEYQKNTKDLKAAWEKSPAKLRKDFIDAAVSGGMELAAATALADSIPGFKL